MFALFLARNIQMICIYYIKLIFLACMLFFMDFGLIPTQTGGSWVKPCISKALFGEFLKESRVVDLSVNLHSAIAAVVESHISSMAARCQLLFRFCQSLQLIFARGALGAEVGEDWKGQVLWGARTGTGPSHQCQYRVTEGFV